MANRLLIKRTATPGKIPALTDLQLGELGINTYDGKLYLKKDNGTPSIVELGAGGGGGGDVYLNVANVFTQPQTINAAVPYLMLGETDAAANEKNWALLANSKALSLRSYDDALTGVSIAWEATRGSGKALTGIVYGNAVDLPVHTLHGTSLIRTPATNFNPLVFIADGRAAGERAWGFRIGGGGDFQLDLGDDAGNLTQNALLFARSGNAITGQYYGNVTDNPPHTFYGPLTVYGALGITGNFSAPNAVYGNNVSRSRTNPASQSIYDIAMYSSGFWEVTGAGWTPTTDWYWGWTTAHTSNSPSYNYSAQWITEIAGNQAYFRTISGGTPNAWKALLHNGNYNNYAPTLTGGGASGTWPINITGSAGSAPANGGTSTYSTYWWSVSHSGTYYLVNNWDGTYWSITSNHANGVRVAYSDTCNNANYATNAGAVAGMALRTMAAMVYMSVSTGTPSVTAQYNVSSVSDNGVGDFTLNYTTAMGGSTTTIAGWCHTASAGSIHGMCGGGSPSIGNTSARFNVRGTGGTNDPNICTVMVSRIG